MWEWINFEYGMSYLLCLFTCRQYEQDSHDELVKTIEGQDLLPQVSWRLLLVWCIRVFLLWFQSVTSRGRRRGLSVSKRPAF